MTQWIRNYEVLRELGSGHFGKVYLAVGEVPARGLHPARRRVVAIKKLRDQSDPESLRLLLQEFALLDQVKHRGIVRVFDYLDEEHAVVMEYVHGVTLRTVIEDCVRSREQVFTEAAIEIGCEIADALYQAWTTPGDNGEKLQLVHRDLKPENIMLTTSGELKILDFGLARVDNADFARDDPDLIRGTPVYMAPEQARGGEIDHRTDLFALGLILYELLASRAAYRVPTDVPDPVARVYAAIENGEVGEAVRELEQKLPGTGPIVARLLQVRPRNRYATGQDLLVDLRRQLYKDRGAYLKEFCGFYFGGIHPLPDPPDAEAPQGGRMSSEKRTSIEERLARAAAEGAPEAAPVAPKGAVPVRRVPRVAPSAAPPPPAPEPAPRAAATPLKITQRPTGRTEPEAEDIVPPSVKGARPAPKGPATPPPRSSVGARSPQEMGMLPMTPLSLNEDEKEAGADPSATSFFAIPAPKAERPKSVSPPVSAAPSGPTPLASGAPAGPGPYTPPAPGAPIPVAAAPAAAAPAIIYANNPAGTPFNAVAGPTPTQGGADESRMQSVRVYVLVLAAFAILCVGTVAAVVLIYFLGTSQKTPETPQPVAAATEAPPPAVPEEPAEPPAVAAKPASTPTSTKPKTKTTTDAAPAAPAEPKSGNGTVSVKISGASPTSVEVSCAGGFRARSTVSGGSASVGGVPVTDDCKLYLKGGVVATPARVKGGRSYSCTVTGTTMQCS